jgi:very-short-patch-repair endonuclease
VAFRRQVVLVGLIVDFFAPAVRLVVEVDGGYHVLRRGADARRDLRLRGAGFRVVRIEAELVHRDLDAVVQRIREAL